MEKLENPELHHYAVFSDNVLAAAVVLNSTLIHAKKPANHVFHRSEEHTSELQSR